jgi:hypothetical protein
MHSYTVADENITQSQEFSPCPVKSEEDLLRLGYHPEHIDQGKIVYTAISSQDLTDRGYSVDRKDYHSKELIENRAKIQMEKCPDKRQTAFISTFSCSSVRNISYTVDNGHQRGFIVLDTADPENQAHASIYATTKTKSILIKVRIELAELLNENVVKLDDFLNNS